MIDTGKINTVIFDIGNVLAGFAWKEFFRGFGYSEDILARIYRATVESGTWAEYDRDALSNEEILEAFIANDHGIEKELRESLKCISGILVRYDYAVPWIEELKGKGYRVLVLSNFAKRVMAECKDALDFLEHVDGGILSYQYKVVKPEPEIYRLIIEKYSLEPEKCVFLDDIQKNLQAAEKFGFHTIHFTDRKQALLEMKKLGIK